MTVAELIDKLEAYPAEYRIVDRWGHPAQIGIGDEIVLNRCPFTVALRIN